MTWTSLLPTIQTQKCPAAVAVSVSRGDCKTRRKLSLCLRPHLFPDLPAWCKPGLSVSVEQGSGDSAGMLRLSETGPWRFVRPVGKSGAVALRLPVPAAAPLAGCNQVPVSYRCEGKWLEITLPAWRVQPVHQVASVAPARPAYVGISARMPDPAIAIQAESGRRVR